MNNQQMKYDPKTSNNPYILCPDDDERQTPQLQQHIFSKSTESIPSMYNTFMNHPKYIDRELLGMESINTANIDVPVDMINLPVIHPFTTTIPAVADNGANIDAISGKQSLKYSKYIKADRRAFRVRTGSGYVWCKEYLPLNVRNGDGKLLNIKMYVMWDLPYDFLIGRSTANYMGYKYVYKGNSTFYHPPQSLDSIETSLPLCSQYPTKEADEAFQPDKFDIADRDPILKEFIINQLRNNKEIISQNEFDIGCIPCEPFKIEFKQNADTTPIKSNEYPHSVLHIDETERQLQYLYSIGKIRPSTSEWRSPTFIVPKKNGESRIVFDYRKLNAITKRNAYPLPSIQTLMDKFKDMEYISTIDMKSGYWHIPIAEEDRAKTAFVFNGKLWEWCVMPFGPTNAPPYFQKVMNEIFKDLEYVQVYLDDITVISKDAESHQLHLSEVFNRLNKYGIKIRADKCSFAHKSTEYLGFIIDKNGSRPTQEYKSKILNVPKPKTKKQLERFLGMVNYLHKYIPSMQLKLQPLYHLKKNNVRWNWTNQCDEAFESIKSQISAAELLVHPDFDKPFEVYCDASEYGIGCVLAQRHGDAVKPVQFCSKLFSKTQQNWHISEQEIYSVIYAVEKWRSYLIGKKFKVFTDHQNLEELFNRAKNFKAGKLYRWAVRLQDFDFIAEHIKGKNNVFADYLSRDGLTSLLPPNDPPPRLKTSNIVQCYTRHHIATLLRSKSVIYPDQSEFPSSLCNQNTTSPKFMIIDKDYDLLINDKCPTIGDDKINDRDSTGNQKSGYNYYDNYLQINPNDVLNNHAIKFIPHHKPKYNTRFQKRQKKNREYQQNLRARLIPIPDSLPMQHPGHLRQEMEIAQIRKQNAEIIKHKPSNPTYNKNLFVPTSLPINDDYDISKLSKKFIQQKQSNDTYLFPIIEYLKNNNKHLLTDLSQNVYRYVLSGRFYLSDSDALYYKYKNRNCIVIPSCLKYSAMRWAHDNIHNGYQRSMDKLADRFWWPQMRDDVKIMIETCYSCQSVKGERESPFKSSKIKTFSQKEPFELVSIDLCGPLPMTDDGNRYIVSMIDKFSRFCLLIPIKDAKATTVIKAYERWVSLFGPPRAILSDNGPQFVSDIFKAYNKELKIKQRFSTPFYPETNGQVERLHRWIKERLALISVDLGLNFIDGDDNWDDYISLIQHSYNSTPNSITSYSPNHVIFGKDLKIQLDRINNVSSENPTSSEYIRIMKHKRSIIHNHANQQQQRYDRNRSRSYNKTKNESISYQVGDYVMIDIHRQQIGNIKKFQPSWIGPFEIIKIIDDKQYHVSEVGNESNVQRVNIRFMKPYKSSPYVNIIQKCFLMMNKQSSDVILNYIRNKYQYHNKSM